METGEIRSNIKTNNGYKIVKFNKKRIFGLETFSYSFIKFSSLNRDLNELKTKNIVCESEKTNLNLQDISSVMLNNVKANEISEIFLDELKNTSEGSFTNIIDISGEKYVLFICEKFDKENQVIDREKIENKIFSEKFQQLSNTYLTNLRKNINVKFFTK